MKKSKRKGFESIPGMGSMRCPYCGGAVVLRSADGIYKENREDAMLYVCANHPRCDAYVRVIPGTKTPMGSLANAELRALRRDAHKSFDRLYKSGLMSRNAAYQWLAGLLQSPLSQAHIGYLGDYYCRQVIEESERMLTNRRLVQSGHYVLNQRSTKTTATGKNGGNGEISERGRAVCV